MTLVHTAGEAHGGAHTQFKNALRADLHKRMGVTMKQRIGPSFDERLEKASKDMATKARAAEAEQRKNLSSAVERGRSRPTSAPCRPRSEGPNQQAMLQARIQRMKEQEEEYQQQLDRLRYKMDTREPLFRVEEVKAAFEMQRRRQAERRQQLMDEERERWEHLRAVEESASKRPLLVEDGGAPYRRPPGVSLVAPPGASYATEPSATEASEIPRARSAGALRFDCDKRIAEAVSQRWFEESDWGRTVKAIKERADNRKKLHEIEYPMKKGVAISRALLMHRSVNNLNKDLHKLH